MKQRVSAQTAKLKRYEGRNKQYHQNRLFESNQNGLFEEIEGIGRGDDEAPNAEESKSFWNEIMGRSVSHDEIAKWLKGLE